MTLIFWGNGVPKECRLDAIEVSGQAAEINMLGIHIWIKNTPEVANGERIEYVSKKRFERCFKG